MKPIRQTGIFAEKKRATTGIGDGIAIPHGKCDAVTRNRDLQQWSFKNGVEFEALDDEPVTLLISDRSSEYRGQHSPGCAQQALRNADG